MSVIFSESISFPYVGDGAARLGGPSLPDANNGTAEPNIFLLHKGRAGGFRCPLTPIK